MKVTASLAGLVALATTAQAHMQISYPPPFRSKYNQYTTDVDYSMTSPLEQSGSNYPCKGYHKLLNTPQGRSVATWQAGSTHNFTVVGSATHNGGSCQASLSFDGGQSFTVIKSYIGNCPLREAWDFTLPSDTPAGEALFAWSWFNNIGNREMYMNCAHVTIASGLTAAEQEPEAVAAAGPIGGRPPIFVANVGNGCGTVEGADVLFPQPGPDVENTSKKTAPPTGNCARRKRTAMPPTA